MPQNGIGYGNNNNVGRLRGTETIVRLRRNGGGEHWNWFVEQVEQVEHQELASAIFS